MVSHNKNNPYQHCPICRHRMYRLADNDKTLLICRDMNHRSAWKIIKRRNRIQKMFDEYRKPKLSIKTNRIENNV